MKLSRATMSEQSDTEEETTDIIENKRLDFFDMGLDERILKAIAMLGWKEPTMIQEKAIPLALDGNDILARARTGSGKTAAFAIPIINKILKYKLLRPYETRKTRAIIVAPSKELCYQIKGHVSKLAACCIREIKCTDITCAEINEVKPILIADSPDIVVGTPSRLLEHINAGSLSNLKKTVTSFAIDEADLLFGFGFQQDMETLVDKAIPKNGCQTMLFSATLTADVVTIKNLVLKEPVILRLEEPELPYCEQLAQYHISCQSDEKFVLLLSLLKLNLLNGRTIVFVDNLNKCYKLKLFLEQFAIKSCILNPELPVQVRCNVVEQFNKGIYNTIIACDEKCVHDPTIRKKVTQAKKKKLISQEFAISRGIDFQSVSNVINFDFPTTLNSYIHRVGRTARAMVSNNANVTEGTVLSFVAMDEHKFFDRVKEGLGDSTTLQPYVFKMEELEAFRYRAKDAIRAVTDKVIRQVRIKEIRAELKNSEKLKSILKTNPNDTELLRHDRSSKGIATLSHLRDVPDYMVPQTLRSRHKYNYLSEQRHLKNSTELSAPSSRKTNKVASKRKKKKLDPLKMHRNKLKRGNKQRKAFKRVKGSL